METFVFVFFLVIGFIIIIAFLIGTIWGQSRSNRNPIIQLANTPNGQPESTAISTGFTYFVIFIIFIALVYYLLQKYDVTNLNTSTVENPPRPYLFSAGVPTTNTASKEPLTTTPNSAQDALPSQATLTPQPEIKVYEQLAALSDNSKIEQAIAAYQHQYSGKRILATDIPNARGYYLVFIELSKGYDANHFMKNHRDKMLLRTKGEILHLFSHPF